MLIKKFFIFILGSYIVSCSRGGKEYVTCERFDLSRLEFNRNYFLKDLYYTNNIDTLKLICTESEISRSFDFKPGIGNYAECRPTFDVLHEDKSKILRLSSFFGYDPLGKENNNLILGLHINFSSIELILDTVNWKSKTTILLGEKHNNYRNNAPGEIIKKIEIEKFRIISIEKESGEVWRLVKVGDSIIGG